jgi:hypothetical protein
MVFLCMAIFYQLRGLVEDVLAQCRRGVWQGQGVAHKIAMVTLGWSHWLVQTPLGTAFCEQHLGAIVVVPTSDFLGLYNGLQMTALSYVHYLYY